MRKLITFLSLFLFAAGIVFAATPGNEISPGIGDKMGQGDLASAPHKIFRLVRWMPLGDAVLEANISAFPTLTADSIVIWDLVSDDGVTVTLTTTSPDSAVAGVIPVAILGPLTTGNAIGKTLTGDIGSRNWGWLQTYGKCEVSINSANPIAAGDAIGTSAEGGKVDRFLPSLTVSNQQGNVGFLLDAGAISGTNIECFLKCD